MEILATSNRVKNNEKIGKVLEKFLQPNFKIRNDVYLNLFLTHLVDKNNDAHIWQTNEQLKEQFCQWIIEASNLWDLHKVNPQPSILSFALSLASQLSSDEQVFVKLNCRNVYESLVGVAETNSKKDPNVTLGLVTLLCSFLENKSGLQWVMATTHWIDVVNLGLRAHTLYIRKKAYQFVTKLLEKTIRFNRNFVVNVVELLIKPLKDVLQSLPSDQDTPPKEVESTELFASLKPSLDLILETVKEMLIRANKNVIQIFLEQETPETIEKLLLLSRSEDFSFELLRIQFVFLFNKVVRSVNGKKVVSYAAITLFDCKVMFGLIKTEMEKGHVRCVVKICDFSHGIFISLSPHMPTVTKADNNVIEFQVQVMFLQIMPIFGFSRQLRSQEKKTCIMADDVFRSAFFQNWLKIGSVQSIEICCRWITDLKTKPNLVEDVIFCLQYVIKMKKLLTKRRVAIIFPALVFSLTDGIAHLKEAPNMELSSSYSLFLKTLVDAIVDFVESFDLTWKDSVETICVMDLAYDYLVYPHWTDKTIIIRGLKLLNTAISKYMSPDMVLLIYHTEDSKVSQTGSLLYAKCHDSCWEIRDSALEVVYTLSLNANTKFPAYTQLLLKAELPQLVVNMALKDGEFYVRATAFKCLQELIQIPEIWNILSNMGTFLDDMLDVFEKETEGVVRKEAASLIYKIDKFQNIPEKTLPRVYDVMTHAATADLHWEVKYSALDFWFNLWEQHLVHQGMIDHTFPSHTFSKEHKKIVTLNDVEVRKRIIKVLNQLSYIGCLYVMKCAVEDDCDVEVSKKATSFTFNMLKMLKMYKIPAENVDLSQPPGPAMLQKSVPISPASFPNQPFIEPISPASPHTKLMSSSASMGNLESTQDTNTPFFDPLSPFPDPFSPSLDIDLLTPSATTLSQISITPNSPQESNTSPYPNSDQQEVPNEDNISSRRQSDTPFTSTLNLINETDVFDYEDDGFDSGQSENIVDSNSDDPIRREQMLEEFLNSNDMTLLQRIYNPTEQVTNNSTQMKTKTYLAPSQYLKFVYNEIETLAMKKTQWMNTLDAFDSLLDDILKEYNIVPDLNSMDCY